MKLLQIAASVVAMYIVSASAHALAAAPDPDPVTDLVAFVFVFVVLFFITAHQLRIRRLRAQDYAWYSAQHPACVGANGVKCYACGASKIHARELNNHMYLRSHYCTQCGETLYYSKELK